jgi:hypothetical protein
MTWSRRNRRVTLRWTFVCLGMAAGMVFAATPARADSWSWFDPEDDVRIMQEVANALADVELLFGTGPLEARSGWVGDASTYAAAEGNGVTVNKAWSMGGYERMAAAVNADVASGFHNSGCSPIRAIALHEAAHVINNERDKVPVGRVRSLLGYGPRPDLRGELSGYSFDRWGVVNAGEALAEAFQAVMCKSAGSLEWQLYEMLVK